jgi:phage baseplate assembly protein gpV
MSLNNYNQMEDNSYEGIFLGVITNNTDPTLRQRIKVKIPRLMDGGETSVWVAPRINSPFGITTTANTVEIPVVGSNVLVEFQNGDINYGLWSGCMDTGSSAVVPELLVNYPLRRGWKDPLGNIFFIDNTAGQNHVNFKHASGAEFDIDNSGNITVTSPVLVTVNAPNTTVNGDFQVNGNISSVGSVTNNGTNIGSTHVHGGVFPGGSNTSTPS